MKMVVKTILRLLLYPFILLLCLVLGSFALFQITPLRTQFLQFATKELGVELQVKSIHGYLPFYIQIQDVELTKEGEPLFTIASLSLFLSPIDLLRGKITITDLELIEPMFIPVKGGKELNLPTLSLEQFHLEKGGWTLEGSLSSHKKRLTGEMRLDWQGFSLPFHIAVEVEGANALFSLTARNGKLTGTLDEGTLLGQFQYEEMEGEFHWRENEPLELFGKMGGAPFQASLDPNNRLGRFTLSELPLLEGLAHLEIEWVKENLQLSILSKHLKLDGEDIGSLFFHTAFDAQFSHYPFTLVLSDASDIKGSGFWSWKEGEIGITLSQLEGTLLNKPLKLVERSHLLIGKQAIFLSPTLLHWGEGTCFSEGHLDDTSIEWMVQCHHFPIKWFPKELVGDWNLLGTLSCDLQLKGSLDHLQGAFRVDFLELESLTHLPPLHGELFGTLDERELTFTAKLQDPTLTPIDVEGFLPLSVSLAPFKVALNFNEKLYLRAKVEANMGPLMEHLLPDTNIITGDLAFDLEATGTLSAPHVVGEATVTHGTFDNLSTGTSLSDLSLHLISQNNKVVVDSIKSSILQGSGTLLIDDHFPFEFHLQLQAMPLLNDELAHLLASGEVILKGKGDSGGVVKGTLQLNEASFHIPDSVPCQTKTVLVTHLHADESLLPIEKSEQLSFPLSLDLTLQFPSGLSVEGRNLFSQWQGDLQMVGTAAKPEVKGVLSIQNGTYDFDGKTFTSTGGTIHFGGDPWEKTTLYVVGDYEIDRKRIQAILKGPLSDPVVSLRSTPPLSQREILSWLLFGRGIEDITPFQAEEISLTNYSVNTSSETSRDLMTRFRNTFGIDRIDINREEAGEENQLSIRLGKYISKGVFVSVSKSITAEANQVAIQANLLKDLKFEAEAGDNAEGKLSIKWLHDY